jgi:Cof subfamily protein (haloacid dehalogenase superfamily)
MVALDLDGTLLQSNHQLADKQAEYLRTLYKSGFRICIATGRAAPSVYDIVKKLALPDPTPVVCSNGARGFLLSYNDTSSPTDNHKKYQKELFYTPVSREAVTKTIQVAKKLGYFVQYYIDDGIYANPITESHREMMKEYEILTDSSIETVDDDFDRFLGTNDDDKLPSKLLVRCEKEEFATCHPSFVELLNSTSDDDKLAHIVAAYNSDLDWFLEILHPEVNKGHGLRNMCQKLEIPMNDVIAIGDGTNDIEFLQMSGLGIAMKNAHESLTKVASYTTEWTNDEHGVIKTLEVLKMKGELFCNN